VFSIPASTCLFCAFTGDHICHTFGGWEACSGLCNLYSSATMMPPAS
jgi:hypothetical protein